MKQRFGRRSRLIGSLGFGLSARRDVLWMSVVVVTVLSLVFLEGYILSMAR